MLTARVVVRADGADNKVLWEIKKDQQEAISEAKKAKELSVAFGDAMKKL